MRVTCWVYEQAWIPMKSIWIARLERVGSPADNCCIAHRLTRHLKQKHKQSVLLCCTQCITCHEQGDLRSGTGMYARSYKRITCKKGTSTGTSYNNWPHLSYRQFLLIYLHQERSSRIPTSANADIVHPNSEFWGDGGARVHKFLYPQWGTTLYGMQDPKAPGQFGSRLLFESIRIQMPIWVKRCNISGTSSGYTAKTSQRQAVFCILWLRGCPPDDLT